MARYHCNYCQEDISGRRVKCADCTDFDLCLQCFASGAEIGGHKNGHSFQVIDSENVCVFSPPQDWKVKEELMLLDAIEQFGFGNWEDIASHIQTRTSEETKEHYCTMFVEGNVGRATWPGEAVLRPHDHSCPDGGPLSPSLCARLSPLELTSQEQQELGYMPNRDDFEREFDNDAETLVSNLVIHQDDEEVDVALKLAHVDMYSRRLRERLRRKRIVREYALIANFFAAANKQKCPASKKRVATKEEREFQERTRTFAQFQSSQDHGQLFDNLQREKELKARIKELARYRRNGVTKLEECAEFDNARCKREKKKENKKRCGSGGQSHRRSTTVAKKSEEKGGGGGGDSAPDEQGLSADDGKEDVKSLDARTVSGNALLSDREKRLCLALSLKPTSYLTFKAVLLKDHLLRKQGISTKGHHPAGLDKVHRRMVINFMVNCGWISSAC